MAIILHSRPTGITWTGPTFLTSSDALTDSKPARTTRIEWPVESPASPELTDTVLLQGQWPTAAVIRGACLLDLRDLPAGVKIEVRGRRPEDGSYSYALGGNALTQRTVQRADGQVCAWWLFADDLDPIVGLEFRVFDDANGATWAGDHFEIGEAFFAEGAEWGIRLQFGDTFDDPSIFRETLGNQQDVVARKRAIVRDFELCPVRWEDAHGVSDSLVSLREDLSGGADCAIIPALREPSTGKPSVQGIDYGTINATALFGKARGFGVLRALPEGPWWTMSMTFRETPGR